MEEHHQKHGTESHSTGKEEIMGVSIKEEANVIEIEKVAEAEHQPELNSPTITTNLDELQPPVPKVHAEPQEKLDHQQSAKKHDESISHVPVMTGSSVPEKKIGSPSPLPKSPPSNIIKDHKLHA